MNLYIVYLSCDGIISKDEGVRGFAHAPTFFSACIRVCATGSKIDDYSFVFDDLSTRAKTPERLPRMARAVGPHEGGCGGEAEGVNSRPAPGLVRHSGRPRASWQASSWTGQTQWQTSRILAGQLLHWSGHSGRPRAPWQASSCTGQDKYRASNFYLIFL